MDGNSIWPGTEYLWIPERGRGETLNSWNFSRCRRVKVWYVVKVGYHNQPTRRQTTIVEVEQLDPVTGAPTQGYTKNIRARHIVCRWDEVAEKYAELKVQRTKDQEERDRRNAEQAERERKRREEWDRRKEAERQAQIEAQRERTERLLKLKQFLQSTSIEEDWIYSTTDYILSIDLKKVERAMQQEQEGAEIIVLPNQSA